MLSRNDAIAQLNELGSQRIPFEFYCDFLGEKWCIEKVDVSKRSFSFSANESVKSVNESIALEKQPPPFKEYNKSFDYVLSQINLGNSFLTNLTVKTPIAINADLTDIYKAVGARYKLLVPNYFVVFSPETFVQISGNEIKSFPMKGTIDADLDGAKEIILNDVKETAEHVTIVDLIRNDLSRVAHDVEVKRFRYLEEIKTKQKNLLQVSSEVSGVLPPGWNERLGELLVELLPAGSISGAPKPETLRIIKEAENYDREFYTGICGRFDGATVDTSVMIRFIKQEGNDFFYCSGGGITSFSNADKEYQEMIDKVYLPV